MSIRDNLKHINLVLISSTLYALRWNRESVSHIVKTELFGTESLPFFAPQLSLVLPLMSLRMQHLHRENQKHVLKYVFELLKCKK